MKATGPARPSLTAQLQEKLRTDREQIEALTTAELAKLAESLSRSSRDALDVMQRDMDAQRVRMRSQMSAIVTRQRLWPLWTALTCMGIVAALFAMLWMATSWKRSELHELIEGTSNMRSTLEDLQRMTGGVRIVTMETGPPVLLVPYAGEDFYLCGPDGHLLCLKLDRTRILTGPKPKPRPNDETQATTSGTE